MKELFVTYNLALLAKEKGFNEECFAAYNDQKTSKFGKTIPFDDDTLKLCPKFYRNSDFSDTTITAPMYQQLLDWIRNNYGYNISIFAWDGVYDFRITRLNDTSFDYDSQFEHKDYYVVLNTAINYIFNYHI